MQILFGRGNWKTERGEETFRIAFILFSLRRNREVFCPYFEGRILDPVLFPLQHDLETGKEEKELHPPLLLDRASSPGRSGKRMCEGGGRKIPGGNFRPIGFFLFPLFQKKEKGGERI